MPHLTPPRFVDIFLGIAFLVGNVAVFACSYFFILYNASDDQALKKMKWTMITYGYLQSTIGFITGLCLARITQQQQTEATESTSSSSSGGQPEEEMMMLITTEGEETKQAVR